MAFIILALVGAVAVVGIGAGINFFWKTGFKRGVFGASLFVAAFFVFWGSGVWLEADPRDWGALTPVFLIILGAGWLVLVLALRFGRLYQKRSESSEYDDE